MNFKIKFINEWNSFLYSFMQKFSLFTWILYVKHFEELYNTFEAYRSYFWFKQSELPGFV